MKPYKIYYHVSSEANITKFQGRYSKKFGMKGLFVCPKFSSIADSWAPYVSGKKHSKQRWRSFSSKNYYQNLTVYKLKIPNSTVEICRDFHNKKYNEALEKIKNEDMFIGAWCYDLELFITNEYLESIEIIGKEKFDTFELKKFHKPKFIKQLDHSYIKYAKEAYRNYAAKKYILAHEMLSQTLLSLNRFELSFVKSNISFTKLNSLHKYFISTEIYNNKSIVEKNFSKKEIKNIDDIINDFNDELTNIVHFIKNIRNKNNVKNHIL